MHYLDTRGTSKNITSTMAILKGISPNGGLFVPENIPKVDISFKSISSYNNIAHLILSQYLKDFTEQELKTAIEKAYSSSYDRKNFDTPKIAPLVNFDNLSFLELYHGKTLSFKDMALSILPHLLSVSQSKLGDKKHKVILTATSGDTGKAALESFKNIKDTTVIVFYPENGISPLQKQTMVTQDGNNVHVYGVLGNFDDAQRSVKKILSNKALELQINQNGFAFSSANSINIGRLLPQIVYYFYAYAQLVNNGLLVGELVNFIVPTGNFGNILAGFYAKKMGLPINKLVCATNKNNVLYDFFKDGIFNPNRGFFTTISPAMDINIPSNFERLLFHLTGSPSETNKYFTQMENHGYFNYKIKATDFVSFTATEEETKKAIKSVYDKYNYVIDPHTAVGYSAYEKFKKDKPTVIMSTASPYKFTKTVMDTLFPNQVNLNDFDQIVKLSTLLKEEIPYQISDLEKKPIIHTQVIKPEQAENVVMECIGFK